jgi:hypothetical protein
MLKVEVMSTSAWKARSETSPSYLNQPDERLIGCYVVPAPPGMSVGRIEWRVKEEGSWKA